MIDAGGQYSETPTTFMLSVKKTKFGAREMVTSAVQIQSLHFKELV